MLDGFLYNVLLMHYYQLITIMFLGLLLFVLAIGGGIGRVAAQDDDGEDDDGCPDFVCPEENGNFADPCQCRRFYICASGIPTKS